MTKVWRDQSLANLANCDISPNFIRQHNYTYRLSVYGLIHVPLHLHILNPRLNHYTWQEKMSILKYFKPADDHLPDLEGLSVVNCLLQPLLQPIQRIVL